MSVKIKAGARYYEDVDFNDGIFSIFCDIFQRVIRLLIAIVCMVLRIEKSNGENIYSSIIGGIVLFLVGVAEFIDWILNVFKDCCR